MKTKLERIYVRMTKKEKEYIMKEADRLNLTISEYIRNRSLNKRKVNVPKKIEVN